MHRRTYFTFIFSIALIFAGVVSASAQLGTIRGEVKVKASDGTATPIDGATVEAIRTDVSKGKLSAVKTNKDGVFVINNVQPGLTFALNVKGPGATPGILPNVTRGMETIEIVLEPGDGSGWTEDQVREALKQTTSMSAEDIEKQKKLIAENQAAKARAEGNHKLVNAALQAGDAAFNAKNYQGAIAKFDEGIAVDPDFAGSAPVLLNYKGAALKELGYAAYLESTKAADRPAKDAALAKAKDHWSKGLEAFSRGLELLNAELSRLAEAGTSLTTPSAQNAKDIETYKASKLNILTNAVEIYRLTILTGADAGRADESIPIFEEYLSVEPEAAKLAKVHNAFGEIMLGAGDVDRAVNAYRQALKASTAYAESYYGLGLSLYAQAITTETKADYQESADNFKKFLDIAPANHKDRIAAQATLDQIIADQKITPKKI